MSFPVAIINLLSWHRLGGRECDAHRGAFEENRWHSVSESGGACFREEVRSCPMFARQGKGYSFSRSISGWFFTKPYRDHRHTAQMWRQAGGWGRRRVGDAGSAAPADQTQNSQAWTKAGVAVNEKRGRSSEMSPNCMIKRQFWVVPVFRSLYKLSSPNLKD